MSNPINPVSRSSAGTVSNNTEKAKTSVKESNADTTRVNTGDTVSLSQGSQQVSSLQQQLKSSPQVDQAKVDSIKQEIANGNYPLDAEKIAENLINLERSLIE